MNENEDEDLDEDLPSEDEGVEADLEEFASEDDETETSKFLHKLAASLAQELEYSHKQSLPSSSREAHQSRSSMQQYNSETVQETSYLGRDCLQDRVDHPIVSVQDDDFDPVDELNDERDASFTQFTEQFGSFRRDRQKQHNPPPFASSSSDLDRRVWPEVSTSTHAGRSFGGQQEHDANSWTAGWDACTTEALRYLVEDEGLPFHHPTVVAMKNHLHLQRERAYAQYVAYAQTDSQDSKIIVD